MSKRRSVKKSSRKPDDDFMAELIPNCHCFICDEVVKNNGVQIILGRTPYSNMGLPAKIGQLIGDSFMVVVGVSDTICARCATLICHLDKLEVDASTVRKTLMGYIAVKYQLNQKDLCAKSDSKDVVFESHEELQVITPCTIPTDQIYHQRKKNTQSLLSSSIKNSKLNVFNCGNCSFSTADKDVFQIHSALCMKQVNQCTQCGQLCNATDQRYSFSGICKVCSSNFASEEEYSKHMTEHVSNSDKCLACGMVSLDKDSLATHILSHGEQKFTCAVCAVSFNIKTLLHSHLESHKSSHKCLKCSVDFVSQSKPLTDGDIALACLSDATDQCNDLEQSRGKNANDYMESLMRLDTFDSDSSNIEFHSCPSCGLTFLDKMLYAEHTKMHDENQEQVDTNEAHEEVLKSAVVSVAGDCSIDDDLEDLFEKLHAETNSSLMVSVQSNMDKSGCLSNQMIGSKSRSEHVGFSVSLKDEDLTICVAPSTVSRLELPQVSPELTVKSSKIVNEDGEDNKHGSKNQLLLNSFDPPFAKDEKSCDNTETAGGTNDDSSQQPTFIYITNSADGLSDCNPQGSLILHNATIDPESGNIHLLSFDTVPTPQLPSPLLENNETNSGETLGTEQNFPKMGGEPTLIENKLVESHSVNGNSLSCNYCGFQTSIELVLKRHLKSHQDNLVQKCSICNSVFSSTQRLLSHLESQHKNVGPITCPFCSEIFDNTILLKGHFLEKHPAGRHNFLCRFCPKKFSTRKMCTVHEESHSEIFKYQCKNCMKKFTSQDDLDDHVKWDHDKVGQCRYCGKCIDKPKALKNHELRHMQESNHHECIECKRVFKTKTGLRHHAASHTGQFKYCCDFCGRGFMSRMMLEEHRSCHTKEERYICDICGQKFTFQSTYWIHRKWHETPYPYKCNYCGRFFKHSSLLAVHKRKHTGERPYKCPHCPLTFPVSGTLKRHVILHTGVYPFNCDVCKRGFTAKHKYASHLKKVHGIQDLGHQESIPNELKVGIPNLFHNSIPGNIKEWDLDDLSLTEEQNLPVLSVDDSSVSNRDPLISDPTRPSRVVEIVLDDSYQAVATVTLGSGEALIPENWYA